MVMPMLIYKFHNPHVLGNKDKNTQSGEIFTDSVSNCFIPRAERISTFESFKLFLFINNTPGHPVSFNLIHPCVEVSSLPTVDTSSAILRPKDNYCIQSILPEINVYITSLTIWNEISHWLL